MSDAPEITLQKRSQRPGGFEPAEPDPLKGGDVYKWSVEQAALIRAGRYDEIDWINVADEIESVGKSELRSLTSNLSIVLLHMLKWDHQPQRRCRSWAHSIDEHRARFDEDLGENPSAKPKLPELLHRAYRSGRYGASSETDLPLEAFPATCPYDWDAIMSSPFVLDQTGDTA